MRLRWPIAAAGVTLVVVSAIAIPRRPAEIELAPGLIGLPQVYHGDHWGAEGWYFTGSAKASDFVERLKHTLLPRGWTYCRTPRGEDAFSYSPSLPLGGLLMIFPFGRSRDGRYSPLSLVVESGRIMSAPPTEPLRGDWTTVKMDSMHAWHYSGPSPFPFWKVYPPQGG